MKTYQKNILWLVWYLVGLISFCAAIVYFSGANLLGAFISFPLFMVIFTFIIMKDVKVFSVLSFVTMLLTSFFIFAVAAKQQDGIFLSSADEMAFLLTFSTIIAFVLVNAIFWSKTKKGWKKIVAIILAIFSVLFLVIFGATPPNFSQNFVYTRIFLALIFILGVYLIMTKKVVLKIFGILGILLSIGLLLFSALLFAGQTYTLEAAEQTKVAAFIEPRVKEMLEYYNQGDRVNFCKYCEPSLKISDAQASPIDQLAVWGRYLSLGEPRFKRETGVYYAQYPIQFANGSNLLYFTLTFDDTSPDSWILGYSISDLQDW